MPRCFIAAIPPPEVLDSVGGWQEMLRRTIPCSQSLRWTPRSQLHLTLLFLGEVGADDIPALTEALDASCAGVDRFHLNVTEAGAFPSLIRPRVLWLGISGELERLTALQASVADKCARFGTHQTPESFKPHLTLARIREPSRSLGQALRSALEQTTPPAANGWLLDSVRLVSSRLLPTGSSYETLASVSL